MVDDACSSVPALIYERANAKREYIGYTFVVGPFYTGPPPPDSLQETGGGTRQRSLNLHRFTEREFRDWALTTTWTVAWNCRGCTKTIFAGQSRCVGLVRETRMICGRDLEYVPRPDLTGDGLSYLYLLGKVPKDVGIPVHASGDGQ